MIPALPDLVDCADEPIRVPGAIQPHGWLLAVDALAGHLVAYSENWQALNGMAAGPAQTQALQALLRLLPPQYFRA